MNNYVLIVKKPNKNFIIDSSSDDLKLLSERRNDLNGKTEFSDLVTLTELSKSYYNEEISTLVKSMKLYQFYPTFRIRISIKTNPNVSAISHCIGTDLTSNPRKYENKFKESMLDILNTTNTYKLLNNHNKFTIDDIIVTKCIFIGMETWIPDCMGNYHSRCGKKSDEYVFNSFRDYVRRHTESPKPSDENDQQMLEMSYSKYDKKRSNNFPVEDKFRNIYDISQVRINRKDELVVISIK